MVYRSTVCLTRVVVDDHARLDVAQIQAVMGRIEAALREIPEGEHAYIANALLSFAVAHCSPRYAISIPPVVPASTSRFTR